MSARTISPNDPSLKKKESRKRVFLVDDHPMMREGMISLIDKEADLMCCGNANSAEEAIAVIPSLEPDLVITDISLPGRNGLELIKDLREISPDTAVIVFSMHDELFYAERALKAGARGYLMKGAGSEKMLDAIRRLLAGEIAVSPAIAAKILDIFSNQGNRKSSSPIEKLTDREFEVYQLLGEGKSTKEIGAQLHLSEKTVAVHRGHIREKLGLGNGAELMRHALRWREADKAQGRG